MSPGVQLDDVSDRRYPGKNVMQPLALHPGLLIVQDEHEAGCLRKQEPDQDEQDKLALQACWQETHHMRSTAPTNLYPPPQIV